MGEQFPSNHRQEKSAMQTELKELINEILENHDSYCLDNAEERNNLALALESEISLLLEQRTGG